MIAYLVRRVLWAVAILVGVSFLTFCVAFLVPADPARTLAGPRASPETLASIRRELGLDQPVPVQYARYLGRAARGDFGRSYVTGETVAEALWARLPATALLAGSAWVCWLVFGIGVALLVTPRGGSGDGETKGRKGGRWGTADTWREGALLAFSILGTSIPTFWLGIVLLYLFAARWRLLPDAGYGTPAHLVLPVVTLTVYGAAYYARLTHANLREVLDQEYIRTARAKGLSERRVLLRHALGNALLPLVTVAGVDLAALLGGVVFTESVFAWPGIGQLAVQSVFTLDIPMILGTVLLSAVFVVLANLVVDLLYPLLDPRIVLR
jgi:peptide/nickel transport system permease protein